MTDETAYPGEPGQPFKVVLSEQQQKTFVAHLAECGGNSFEVEPYYSIDSANTPVFWDYHCATCKRVFRVEAS